MARKGVHRPSNPDNKLKCDVAGSKGWREVKFHVGKNPDGTVKTVPGFKNVLNDQEYRPGPGQKLEPPGFTGDIACVRHNSEAYRNGWDRIWGPKASGQDD